MEFYHVLNRGVDKRLIFNDKKDYFRFVHDLFEFNDRSKASSNNFYFAQNLERGLKYYDQKKEPRELLVNIHCFALMPNHYHLLLSPVIDGGITKFMTKLNIGYAKYFNEKYQRVGALFQGRFKRFYIENDRHFLFIPYYIHFNPLDLSGHDWRGRKIKNTNDALSFLENYRWSSHLDYLGKKNFPAVTQRGYFLDFFGGEEKYRKSVKEELKNFSIDGSPDYKVMMLE